MLPIEKGREPSEIGLGRGKRYVSCFIQHLTAFIQRVINNKLPPPTQKSIFFQQVGKEVNLSCKYCHWARRPERSSKMQRDAKSRNVRTNVSHSTKDGPCASVSLYKPAPNHLRILTTLAFWLRSSVVSVLNSLTTIMEAPPPFLVI